MSPALVPRRAWIVTACAAGLAALVPGARACDFSARTLRIWHPWTRETAQEAGSAIVCMKFDQVREDDRLIGVSTPVADGADMGGLQPRAMVDFAIPKGQDSALSEGTTFVRLTGLRTSLDVGRAYPLTLEFDKGGTVLALLNVDYARFR